MFQKLGFRHLLIVALLILSAFWAASLVGAQTPAPGATATEEPTVSDRPDLAAVMTRLRAEAVTEVGLDTLAQWIAQQYGTELGAEYAEAHVFTVPADTTFEDTVTAFEAAFGEVGWQASEAVAEITETYSTAAWTGDNNAFLIYYQPAARDQREPVLVTVDMLTIRDIQGLRLTDSDDNPALAAMAEQIARSTAQKTGAETEVRIMTFPSSIAPAEIMALYQDGMARMGWAPVDAFTQVTEALSSMGWTKDNAMLLVFAGPISKDPADDNMLLQVVAKPPMADAVVTPQVTPDR